MIMSRNVPVPSKKPARPSMPMVSGTSICTWEMWSRFQIGSNRPLAKRSARMLSTDSLPRKWSIRNTCSSAKTAWTAAVSSWQERRSVPNGFSMMTRAFSASPVWPSMATTGAKADGGTAGWNRRRGVVGVGGAEAEPALERLPGRAGGAGQAELGDRGPGVGAELVLAHREPRGRGADHPVPVGQQAGLGQVEQAGQQLAPGQVAGRAEQHDDVVVGAGVRGHDS